MRKKKFWSTKKQIFWLIATGILFTLWVWNEHNSLVYGYHNFFFRSAADLTSGILQNERLDNSSITKQGNTILLTSLDSRITNIEISTSVARRSYNIVIGSLTALAADVDIASDTADGLREAVRRLTTLVNPTTGYGSILYRTGSYFFNGATVPSGISVYALDRSSVVWNMASTSSGIAVCYGNIDGITFSFNNLAWTSVGIEASTGCKMTNITVINGGNMSATAERLYLEQD